jgi:hypothetical protein
MFWYVTIGLGVLGGIFLWLAYIDPLTSKYELGKWVNLIGYGGIVLGLLIRRYWRFRGSVRFWSLLFGLALVHGIGYRILFPYGISQPAFVRVFLVTMEAMLFALVVELTMHWHRRAHD